jgi:hypothetical protein
MIRRVQLRSVSVVVVLFLLSSCSHNTTRLNEKTSGEPSGARSSDTAEMLPPKPKKSTLVLDPAATAKSKPLFEAVIKNDDKKAKLAYGRAVRALPEIVQLAIDLRFKNYDHAATILAKTPLSQEQKDFWQKIIDKKPKKLGVAVCSALVENPNFPPSSDKISAEEESWFSNFESVVQSVLAEDNVPKVKSSISETLDKIPNCNGALCTPLTEDIEGQVLTDEFFDNLHNMKRRDTHFWQGNYKSLQKVGEYSPYVTDNELYKFYRTLKASPTPKQDHFLRRFKGIARDMRAETILSRSIADIVLEDQDDKVLAYRLGTFLRNNALISAITRIEGEVPACQLAPAKLVKAPKKNTGSSEVKPMSTPESTATPAATAAPTP